MKKSTAILGLFAAAVALLAPAGFAEDQKGVTMDKEIVFVPNRTCGELPADIQKHSIGCDQVTFGKRQYAKVTLGYAPLEKQAMESDELSMQHGG